MATSAPRGRGRVRAPELRGRRWLGAHGDGPSLSALRGSVVLLHFWTGSCVNCLHALEELREVEERFAGRLVVLGVHSPKFPHEGEPAAVEAAVRRHGVRHPVLDDPELRTWRAYAVRAWPTLVVVDPEGYVAEQVSGEGHGAHLAAVVGELAAGRGAVPAADPHEPAAQGASGSALSFPSRLLPLPAGGWLVADSGGHRLAELDADLRGPVRHIGSGRRGLRDGGPAEARFAGPQGLARLPPDVAARTGYDLLVADTGNHALRGVRSADGHVRTVAGTGRQLRRREGGGPALEQDLASPWDVAWFDGQVVVAMAGTHQLWAFDPAADPADGVLRVLAGTTAEGLRDGPAEEAWFAQPSALAAEPAGRRLWFVDAETSALRWLQRAGAQEPDRSVPVVTDPRMANVTAVAGPGYVVGTAAGSGLFDFGLRDGPGAGSDDGAALLQHPLGLALAPDGSVLVADTYNGAVRRYDPAGGWVSTLLTGLAEPVDVAVRAASGPDGVAGLLVVESAAHRVSHLVPPAAGAGVVVPPAAGAGVVVPPAVELPAGWVRIAVDFVPPAGQELDARGGEPARLHVEAHPPALLAAGSGTGEGTHRDVRIAEGAPAGALRISAQVATCDRPPPAGAAGAACHLHRGEWWVPVRVVAAAQPQLHLRLRTIG